MECTSLKSGMEIEKNYLKKNLNTLNNGFQKENQFLINTKQNSMKNIGCKILLGTRLAGLISIITFGKGKYLASYIAVNLLGFKSCGCCEREQWLNRLTCKDFDGNCKGVKLF